MHAHPVLTDALLPLPPPNTQPQIVAKLLGIGVKALHQRSLQLFGLQWSEFLLSKRAPRAAAPAPHAVAPGSSAPAAFTFPAPALMNYRGMPTPAASSAALAPAALAPLELPASYLTSEEELEGTSLLHLLLGGGCEEDVESVLSPAGGADLAGADLEARLAAELEAAYPPTPAATAAATAAHALAVRLPAEPMPLSFAAAGALEACAAASMASASSTAAEFLAELDAELSGLAEPDFFAELAASVSAGEAAAEVTAEPVAEKAEQPADASALMDLDVPDVPELLYLPSPSADAVAFLLAGPTAAFPGLF